MDRYCELVLSFLKTNMMPLAQGRDKSHKWIPCDGHGLLETKNRYEEDRAGFIGSLLGDSEILDPDLQPPDGWSIVPAQPCLAQSKANLLEGYQSLLP